MTFSEGSKVVLQDLFTTYPPDDGELEEKVIGKYSGKTAKIRRKKDDIFSKPLMSAADVAERVEQLASRRVKDSNLRQVLPYKLFNAAREDFVVSLNYFTSIF